MEVIRSKDHIKLVKLQCGKGLGRVGACHPDFSHWASWMWRQLEGEKEEGGKVVFLLGIEECLEGGGGTVEGVNRVLEQAKSKLEETQSGVMMMALLGVMEAAAEKWHVCFRGFFQVKH